MKEIDNFIKTLRSDRTRRSYKSHIDSFCDFKNIKNLEDFKRMTCDDFYEFKNYLIEEKNNSENSLKPKFVAISSFYDYLITDGKYGVTENIIEKNKITKSIKAIVNPQKRTFLTAQERALFLKECKNPKETAICTVFLNTAIRISELINLKLNQYVRYTNKNGEKASYLYFVRKGGKIKKLYFNPYVTEKIEDYLKVRKQSEYDNLFISNGGKPMSVQSIDMTIKKLAKRAGITKSISAHSLRRTVATDMNKQGIPLKNIQETLGHSSVSTTGLYIQDLDEDNEDLMMSYEVKGEE